MDGNAYDNVEIKDGIASMFISDLGNGTHTITAQYNGDANYNASDIVNLTVKVNRIDPSEDIEIDDVVYGQNATVNVELPGDATGNVTVMVDGVVVCIVPVVNGTAEVIIPELTAGNHSIEITYMGDDNYSPFSEVKEIDVSKQEADANVTVPFEINTGENATVNVDLPVDATGNVVVMVELVV